MKSLTQVQCKEFFVSNLQGIIESFDSLEAETPWSNIPPEWWFDMMALQKTAREMIEKHRAVPPGCPVKQEHADQVVRDFREVEGGKQ